MESSLQPSKLKDEARSARRKIVLGSVLVNFNIPFMNVTG